jgi:hypothetical protein
MAVKTSNLAEKLGVCAHHKILLGQHVRKYGLTRMRVEMINALKILSEEFAEAIVCLWVAD